MYIASGVFAVVFVFMMIHHISSNVARVNKAHKKAAQGVGINATPANGLVKRTAKSSKKGDPLWFMWSILFAVLFVILTFVVNSAIGQYANRDDVYAQRQTQFEVEVSRLQDPAVADRLLAAALEDIQNYGGNNARYDEYLMTTAVNAWLTLIDNAMNIGDLTQAQTRLTELQSFAGTYNITNPAISFAETALTNAQAAVEAGTDAAGANTALANLNAQLGLINEAWSDYQSDPAAPITIADSLTIPALAGVESWIGEITVLQARIAELEGQAADLEQQVTDLDLQIETLQSAVTNAPAEAVNSRCVIESTLQTLSNGSTTLTLDQCAGETVTYQVCWLFNTNVLCNPQMADGESSVAFFTSASSSFTVTINGGQMSPSGNGPWTPVGD
jgi:hypothetical protein